VRTTLNLDDRLVQRAKREAASRGTTLTELIEMALQALLSTERVPRRKLALPVTEGRAPVVDVADREALYDLMDGRS
jgi:hypothetical protein